MNQGPEKREIFIQGVGISEGIAMGRPHFAKTIEETTPDFPIPLSQVDFEIARYRKALFSSREDLFRIRKDLAMEGSHEAVSFIETHIQMLEDPMITTHMEEKIRLMLRNTEAVFCSVISDYKNRFTKRSAPFVQERLADVSDVSSRILTHLQDGEDAHRKIPTGSVIIGPEIAPTFMAAAQAPFMAAFVTERGGSSSHAALIARSKGLPFVSGIGKEAFSLLDIDLIIVDGSAGVVILNPEEETIETYLEKQKQAATRYQLLLSDNHLPAKTIDGVQTHLLINVGHIDDLDRFPYSHDGIGLFRSEYLLLNREGKIPSEEWQTSLYTTLLRKAEGKPVVIRVFDLGGDKHPDITYGPRNEANPAMGFRGIRFLLRHPRLFRSQLRAIHIAAAGGYDAKILLPLISDIGELLETRALIEEVKQTLRAEGKQVPNLPVGCMIEVPSAALMCDAIAAHSDFLSLGTNDLIQYTLGVDRANPAMSEQIYPAHPSLLRMINMVVVEAKKRGVPLSICGEIASNTRFIPLLLGLGLTHFSVAPRYLPYVKQAIRKASLSESRVLAEKALQAKGPEDVIALLSPVPTAIG